MSNFVMCTNCGCKQGSTTIYKCYRCNKIQCGVCCNYDVETVDAKPPNIAATNAHLADWSFLPKRKIRTAICLNCNSTLGDLGEIS